ncbi:MAG TPA: glutamate-cysteine ligase family protein [Candidatus Polarisedimenticolia bacterium]|nr:glutamate-cysteine ligase family protein [Candidatus Polarisedimenticolia bacterium]
MSTLFGDRAASAPLRGGDELAGVFRAGEKPPARFGVGIEYERLPLDPLTGRAVPYASPHGPSVERFLQILVDRGGWVPRREEGRIIALEREGTRVTLEPGAQVELSGRVHAGLLAARDEVAAFVRESDDAAAAAGFRLAGIGLQPFSEPDAIGWVPKRRYGIMAPYLATRGHLAHAMMKATAGCQINLDYSSEQDAMEKLRVALAITSIVTALCARSPLTAGQRNGFLTKRSLIWMHTDPDRCGLPWFALSEGAGYADAVAHALDVPMLFVVREDRWMDMTGRTFRQYLAGRNEGLSPVMADWELHLTTLFPEVRLKAYLEVRGSDSGPPDMVAAQAALWKGILYDASARRAAWEMAGRAPARERASFHREVARSGLRAKLGGHSALDLSRELIAQAARALPADEAALLEPLRRVADEGISPAETLLRQWNGAWDRRPPRLVRGLAGGESGER